VLRRQGGGQRGICSAIVDDQGSVLKALPFAGFGCLHFRAFFSHALQVKLIGKQFRGGRQEDAHEFMIHLMDAMQVSGTGVSNLAVVMIVGELFMILKACLRAVLKLFVRRLACVSLESPPRPASRAPL
jgi:hypothetical protein